MFGQPSLRVMGPLQDFAFDRGPKAGDAEAGMKLFGPIKLVRAPLRGES